MPDCPVCAFDNPVSAAACANCGAELLSVTSTTAPRPAAAEASSGPAGTWDGPMLRAPEPARARVHPEQSAAPAPRPPGAGPGGGRRKGADLALEPAELDVEPGSTVVTTVTAHNLGAEVERFTLEVNGPGGAFATAEPPDLRMLPDKKASAVIRFTPVREARQRAGPYPFQVVARSTVNPDVVQRASGVVSVGGFARLDAELTPEVTRGRRPGTHRLALVNAGNEPARVQVALHDDTGELVFDPAELDDVLEPGGSAEPVVRIGGPVPWFGRTKSFPFTAEVSSTGVPQPQHLQGVRRQVPRLPWWVPTVALALVGLAIAVIALLPDDRVPPVVGEPEAVAVTRIEDAGYRAVSLQQQNEKVAPGVVFGTDPAGGQVLDDGESVGVLVSQGACPAGCPVPVPNVVGLPVGDATRHLEAAGLIARANDAAGAPAGSGTVTATTPDVGQPVGDDRTVALTVATVTPSAASSAASSASEAASSASASASAATSSPTPSPSVSSPAESSPAASTSPSVPVPPVRLEDFARRPLGTARTALEAAGLVVRTTTVRTDDVAAGQVVSSDPPAGADVEPGGAVTLTVAAAPVVVVDAAAQAAWQADGAPLTFGAPAGGAPPAARVEPAAQLEDGSTARVLVTQPATAGGTVSGDLGVPGGVLPRDRLVGRVGFARAASGAVDFVVTAGSTELARLSDTAADGALVDLDVDLSGVAGQQTVRIAVVVPAEVAQPTGTAPPAGSAQPTGAVQPPPYLAVWEGLRIVTRDE